MAEGIRTLDFFRFTPTKFIEQTITGALISLGVIALAIYLVLSEVNLVLNEEVRTEILFENLHMEDL